MKLYTTPEQTAKLIEFGFEPPKIYVRFSPDGGCWADYTLGELIEMLPKDEYPGRRLEFDGYNWVVDWDAEQKIMQTMGVELIDALYEMLVMLKEKGVI